MNKKVLLLIFVILIAISLVSFYKPKITDKTLTPIVSDKEVQDAGTFYECVKEGNPVQESWPPACRTKSGKLIVQDIGNEQELTDQIKINSPRPTTKVTSVQKVIGEARGGWFFEGQFSAKMLDGKGQIIGEGIMKADREWMTEDFVPFSGEITFDPKDETLGKLILEKANPSGIVDKNSQLIVVVRFN